MVKPKLYGGVGTNRAILTKWTRRFGNEMIAYGRLLLRHAMVGLLIASSLCLIEAASLLESGKTSLPPSLLRMLILRLFVLAWLS
ncbi:hypothetical protein COLO4_36308 [Corchorus olitorius]|uniref:Uncharacterized protein n=1 Tax=Corchorus olitorius TaxID=93759 RepID=A0A1R3GA88_9ROSI|nr:hypothetical protein COLO4_36308 [Corchorus olitorius]